jgi:anti-anti-sigma factor
MEFSSDMLGEDITRVVLNGRMDIAGAGAVEMKLNLAAGTAKNLLIDLEKVTFLGSMGLGTLVMPSRAVRSRGGKVVFFNPSEMVEAVLKSSGIDTLFPVYRDLDAAIAALK